MSDRIVEVIWEGGAMNTPWAGADDIPPNRVVRSVGVVLRDDDARLVLAQSLNVTQYPVGHTGGEVAGLLTLPRSAIRKVTELKRGRASPNRR